MNDAAGLNDDHRLLELVQIYGEIDRAIKREPRLAARVSWLLPVYAEAYAESDHPNVHWFDEFEDWMQDLVRENGGEAEAELFGLGLGQSIERLTAREPVGRMRARRLHAAGAAARILRDELDDRQLAAIAVGQAAIEDTGDPDTAARELARLLRRDPEGIETQASALEAWWGQVRSWGPLRVDEVGPPPCSGGIVWVDVEGESEPVATLETVFESHLPFEAAENFCDPLMWKCFAFWCDMKALGPEKGALKATDGVREFREIVSLDCHNEPSRLAVDLKFTRTEEPDPPRVPPRVTTTEYELAGEDPHVAVNEGTLEVVELLNGPPNVRVRSTKRLKFKGTFDGPAFASVMCLIGYLSYVEDLLHCAADPEWKDAFPGDAPDNNPYRTPLGADPYFPGLTKHTIQRVAAALEDCLDGYSKPAEPAPGTPGKRPSSAAGTPVQSMADMYARMLREGARVADMGLRGVTGASGRRSGAGAARSAAGEVVEDWADLGRLLVGKWRDHASQIATKLDAPTGYDADKMAADLATTASLAIETGARLTWEALDSATILGRRGPLIIESHEFSIGVPNAELELVGDLKSGLGHKLPAWAVLIVVTLTAAHQTTFKLRAITAVRRAGTYRGEVRAPAAAGVAPVKVRIVVP